MLMLILKQRDSRSARGLSTSKWMVIYACLTRFSLHDVDRVTQHSRNDSIGTAVGRGAARGVTGMFAGLYPVSYTHLTLPTTRSV